MTKPLVDSGEFRRVGDRVVPWPSFVVSVQQSVLASNASAVKQTLEVVQSYAERLQRDANAFQFVSQRYHLKPVDTQEWLASTHWCMNFDRPTEQLVGVLNYLQRLEIISHDATRSVDDLWFDLKSC